MGFTPIPACSFCRYGCFAIPGPGPKAGGLRPKISLAERGRIGASRQRNTEDEKTDEGRKLRLPCQVSERKGDSCDQQNWPPLSDTRNRDSSIRFISFCEATYGRFSRLILLQTECFIILCFTLPLSPAGRYIQLRRDCGWLLPYRGRYAGTSGFPAAEAG